MKRQGCFRVVALYVTGLLAQETGFASEAHLRCRVEQGGSSRLIETRPTASPYTAPAFDINDRFRFKPVIVQEEGKVGYIKLYSYYKSRTQVILLHQATHAFPELSPGSQVSLGSHHVYAPPYEWEMQYSCDLYQPVR